MSNVRSAAVTLEEFDHDRITSHIYRLPARRCIRLSLLSVFADSVGPCYGQHTHKGLLLEIEVNCQRLYFILERPRRMRLYHASDWVISVTYDSSTLRSLGRLTPGELQQLLAAPTPYLTTCGEYVQHLRLTALRLFQ